MPICNKPAIPVGSRKGATEIDDHASEAAKLKRAREQAYFNSYNFDAIEVLPYENEIENEVMNANPNASTTTTTATSTTDATSKINSNKILVKQQQKISQSNEKIKINVTNGSNSTSSNSKTATTTTTASSNISSSSNSSSSSGSGHCNNNEKVLSMKYAYLQRLGAFFVSSHDTKSSGANENLQKITKDTSTTTTTATTTAVDGSGGNFLLPRAMLKYQSNNNNNSNSVGSGNSNVGATNSMPAITHQQQQQQTNGIGGKIMQKDDNKTSTMMMTTNTISLMNKQQQQQPPQSYIDHEDTKTGFLMLQENLLVTKTTKTLPRNKKHSTSSTTTTVSIESLEQLPTTKPLTTKTTLIIANDRNLNSKTNQPPRSSSASTESNEHGTALLGRANSHQSHYSTDKSGSSGYYSSNVCSTYSVEDHIYCEPVIDILDLNGNNGAANKQKSKSGQTEIATIRLQQQQQLHQQQKIPPLSAVKALNLSGKASLNETHFDSQTRTMNVNGSRNGSDDTEGDDDESDEKTMTIHHRRHPPQNFSEKLRILETSIDNLDRHLKNFPSLSSQERIVSYVQSHQPYLQTTQQHEPIEKQRLPYNHHLPTIMEGYDPCNQSPRPWQDDIVDDSLLDIDLDSFLLTNETKDSTKRRRITATPVGIDNPTFLTDEVEENNYKCAKYINSCPENAYNVESDIVGNGTESRGTASQKSLSAEHYMRRYEDQLHFQNTRELLEDVRDKIRVLSQSNSVSLSSNSTELSSQSSVEKPTVSRQLSNSDESTTEVPKELESMIKTLKNELESYIDRINQRSEYEIRQLCTGLVKNEHIVKMKKAFERRRSLSEQDYLEAINSSNALVSLKAGVPPNIRQQLASIRCASDPNFKMKRKSLTEVFPAISCYIETANEPRHIEHAPTQLQRNLSFHKPVLEHLSPVVLVNNNNMKSAGNIESNTRKNSGGIVDNGLSGSNSTESGESGGDKDSILDWHRKRPSIWEQYYGTNRMHQSLLGKRNGMVVNNNQSSMSYPSSRPESDFTLDLPRAEQLRIKMEKEKKFRQRCRFITTFLSLVFFLLTVMVVSLVLTRGKRMFGSMI